MPQFTEEFNTNPATGDSFSLTLGGELSNFVFTADGDGGGGQGLAFDPNDGVGNSDGSLTATAVGQITVNQVNAPPVLATPADQTTNEDQLLTFNLVGTDVDGDTLTYSCKNDCPTGLTVNPTSGQVYWTPDFTQAVTYNITFAVSDGSLEGTAIGKISVGQSNAPPVLDTPADQIVDENALLTFTLTDSDVDADSLTFSCQSDCPAGLVVAADGTVTWTPDYTQAGVYNVTFAVSDGSLTATAVGQITVNQVNAPPVLATPADQTTNENQLLTFTLAGTDVDGDTLTYSCKNDCPTGLTVDPNTGQVDWTPDFIQAGTYNVTFAVSDGSLEGTAIGKISVGQSNAPPVLDTPADQIVDENALLTFTLTGTDDSKVDPLREKVKSLLDSAAEYEIGAQEKTPLAKTVRTCRQLLKVEPALWLFASVKGIEPTNNAAERAIRPAVLWRKNSFGCS